MKADRVSSNHQIFNFVVVEDGQEFVEVLVEHRASVPLGDSLQAKAQRWRSTVHSRGVPAIPGIRRPSFRRDCDRCGRSCPYASLYHIRGLTSNRCCGSKQATMGDGTRGFNRRMKTTVADSLQLASVAAMALAAIAWLLLSGSLNAADWPTFAHDPQRSGWAFDEGKLTAQSVVNLELKWKAQLKNEPRSLTALTAPVVAADVETSGGIKTL